MARVTGLDIYKLLPKTNCGDCNFPTCMAFAMQVAAKKVALQDCPHVSSEAQTALAEASAPPMRLVTIGTGDRAVAIGGETALFRHEEKFHHPAGIAIRVKDDLDEAALSQRVRQIGELRFLRTGSEVQVDLVALECASGSADRFAAAAAQVASQTDLPLVLICPDPGAMKAALAECADRRPLLYAATPENAEEMADLARGHNCPLAAAAADLEGLAELTQALKDKGVEDLVLDPRARALGRTLISLTRLRRLALERNFRPLGYPVMTFAYAEDGDPYQEVAQAISYVCKYGNLVVLDRVERWAVMPVLQARQNIYTDPQVPNAVEAKLYTVGDPGPRSPVLVTTNFALTYFTVEGEVENSKVPSYIAVVDTEGLGVLNAYADDKLTGEAIIKTVQATGVMDRVEHNKVIIPGLVAVLRMEVQEDSGWEVLVGPEEAAGIPSFLKNEWKV